MTTLAQLTPMANPIPGTNLNHSGISMHYVGPDQILFEFSAADLVPQNGGGGGLFLNPAVASAIGIYMWEGGGTLDLSTMTFGGFTTNDFTGTAGHFVAIFGNAGGDVVIANNVNYLMMGEGGNDTLTGGAIEDYIYGGADNDILNGGGWGDSLWGDGGTDTIHGDAGADNMWGGDGDDSLYSEDGNVDEGTVDGGDGIDTLYIDRTSATVGIVVSRSSTSGEVLITQGTDSWSAQNIEVLRFNGSGQADTIEGIAGQNVIESAGGDDVITLTSGNHMVWAGAGDDQVTAVLDSTVAQSLYGGDGDGDLLVFDYTADDSDFTFSAANFAAGGIEPILYVAEFERIDGTFGDGANIVFGGAMADRVLGMAGDDTLYGGGGADTLLGGANYDTLDGGTGADTLDGGTGNDVLTSGTGETDEESYDGGEGRDELAINRSTSNIGVTITASQVIDVSGTWSISGFERLVFTGGNGNDDITGFSGSSNIFGGGGDDTVTSNSIYDQVSGGAGQDHLILDRRSNFGGLSINFTASRQVLEERGLDPNANNTLFDGYWGFETFTVKGSAYGDQVTGDAASDVLFGYAGRDTLSGLGGADRLEGGDGIDTLDGGDGDDLILGGTGGDSLDGGDGADMITGGSGIDMIEGGAGDDIIDGGTGADVMDGGAGDDRYTVDDAMDIVAEEADGGTDTIFSTALSNVLRDHVERITLLGAQCSTVMGNDMANIILGNSGANVLRGGGGDDFLRGGQGRDLLTGGSGSDRFDFDAVADSLPSAATRDVIMDFTIGQDRIDVSTIDAITGGVNDRFGLLAEGTASSAVGAGKIGWYHIDLAGTANDATVLRMNVDGDAAIEIEIALRGLVKLSAANFIL